MPRQLDYVRRSTKDYKEAVDKIWERYREQVPGADDAAVRVAKGEARAESLEGLGGLEGSQYGALEAIVLAELRPAYMIVNDQIELRDSPVAEDPELVQAVTANKADLERIGKSVGRVDLFNHWSLSYAGTGWLIDDDIVVTNRHVARFFAEKNWAGEYRFKTGVFNQEMEARLDYVRQHGGGGTRRRAAVLEVLYIASDQEADIAFLLVEPEDDVEPLQLLETVPSAGLPVAAVGYPASDAGRNDPDLMQRLFGTIYEVKRFSPGYVTGTEENGIIVTTDYTSLGGNSGSPVIDLETGKAVALHFAGTFRDANYAVAADIVAAALARVKTTRVTTPVTTGETPPDPTSDTDELEHRGGYDAAFLGKGDLEVPMPHRGPWGSDVAPVSDDRDGVLRYTHFSVVQSASRRLPLITAVNIDGEKSFRLKRKGSWRSDGRLDAAHQVSNMLYKYNPLDRGHMVRRMDPGWGDSREEAQKGETDTFHYTNSAPQHKDLNQKDWLGLEDYVLEAADTRDFKVSVFTGPIFRDDDKTLRKQPGAEDIPIPEEFWKVVVMVNADTGRLSATGYVLSHGRMIRDITEAAFVYGEYETYQVQIARIEGETGLDFGRLRDADPLGAALDTESPFGVVARRITGPESLQLA